MTIRSIRWVRRGVGRWTVSEGEWLRRHERYKERPIFTYYEKVLRVILEEAVKSKVFLLDYIVPLTASRLKFVGELVHMNKSIIL